jgi:hypothetical protein
VRVGRLREISQAVRRGRCGDRGEQHQRKNASQQPVHSAASPTDQARERHHTPLGDTNTIPGEHQDDPRQQSEDPGVAVLNPHDS